MAQTSLKKIQASDFKMKRALIFGKIVLFTFFFCQSFDARGMFPKKEKWYEIYKPNVEMPQDQRDKDFDNMCKTLFQDVIPPDTEENRLRRRSFMIYTGKDFDKLINFLQKLTAFIVS